LQFSSKPASGLSQASIFGASLGGLILNIQNTHPNTQIRNEVGLRDEEGCVISHTSLHHLSSKAERLQSQELYLASGRVFYTRPVIDYDMALFLAPMEMAGAVMGVLIQTILPDWLFLTTAGIILGLTSLKTFGKFLDTYRVEKQQLELRRLVNEREAQEEEGEREEEEQEDGSGDMDQSPTGTGTMEIDDKDDESVSSEKISKDQDDIIHEDQVDESITSKESTRLSVKSGNGLDTDELLLLIDNVGSVEMMESAQEQQVREEQDDEHLEKRRELLEQDARQYPKEKLLYLVILWLGLTFITFLKGGKGVDSLIGITCQSPWFIVLIVTQFLWTFGFSLIFGVKLIKKQEVRFY
jgi:hypothetical protein